MTNEASTTPGSLHLETADRYLDLMKKCLTRTLFEGSFQPFPTSGTWKRRVLTPFRKLLSDRGLELVMRGTVDQQRIHEGRVWPLEAETMIGFPRLDNLQDCVRSVVLDDVEGDVIETGVWRGGACIFMRAALEAYGDRGRTVWVADSFRGLPKPDEEKYPADAGDMLWTQDRLAISVDEVRSNFARYGLLDDRVRFLVGWFKDTLPTAPIDKLSIMRLDGDLYESTMDALVALYPKLSVGGYVIIDDYGAMEPCRKAVADFREAQAITDEIHQIDWTGAYWRRSA